MNISMNDLAAGVQNKTACVLAIANQDNEQAVIDAINKRLTEIAGMIELIGLANHPDYQALNWLRRYQDELVRRRWDIEGR